MGDFVLSTPDLQPPYADSVSWVKGALEEPLPPSIEFDPFGKLRIANAEIDELVGEVDDWIRVGNHVHVRTLVRRTAPVMGTMRIDHEADFDDPPPGWATRTARIIGDLRSQLDHLIVELAIRASPDPITEGEIRNLAFPVEGPQRPYTLAKLRKKLPQLSEAGLTVILEAQPGHEPGDFDHRQSTLWLLNKLNNLDKHRALNITGTSTVDRRGPSATVFAEGEILIPTEDMFYVGEPCRDGCVVDVMVSFGAPDASSFRPAKGTIEPLVGLCRFLRSAFALVGTIVIELLIAEGVYPTESDDGGSSSESSVVGTA